MSGICEGRVVIITGAGRGLGRAHALEFARQGAAVVVNDVGVAQDGSDPSATPAQEVVDEIVAGGGRAVPSTDDDTFGGLDTLVNNAGIVRDRMFVSAQPDEWDAVMHVHLRGHFAPARHAVNYWRAQAKEGNQRAARIINTSSGAGLMGSIAQAAYSAAKAGIATLTLVQAAELGRYGITSNALAPSARTRMTEEAFPEMMAAPTDASFDAMDPANVSPLVAWLGSDLSGDVTGRVFESEGGKVGIAEGWRHGPSEDKGARWEAAELSDVIARLLVAAETPTPVYGAQ